MSFLGRDLELNELKERLQNEKFEAVLMYGRRRVGKTELVNEAIRQSGIKSISFVCANTLYEENVKSLSKTVTSFFGEDFINFTNLEHILQYVFKKAENEPLAFFVDEYPFLRGKNTAIDSYFQIAIDKFHNNSKLKLILCGSYIDTMKSLIDSNAPLFGRFTQITNLQPFDYYDAAKFFPNISNEKKFEFYACFGGIPFYLNMIDSKKSLEENLEKLLLPSNSILETEITVQLKQEIEKVENLNYILSSIGSGIHANNDLRVASEVKSPIANEPGKSLSFYINKLTEINLIEKTSPINDRSNRKSFSYYISDNLLDFYYTFLSKRQSERSFQNPKQFFEQFVKQGLKEFYLPKKFEALSKEFLVRMNKAGKINPLICDIGRYVYNDRKNHKNGEFDVATRDESGWVCYECKYLERKVDSKLIAEKIHNTESLNLNFYKYGFFSRKGFADSVDKEKYILYTLDDIYGL